MDVPVWDVTVFTKNRDRLLEGDIACAFLTAILADPQVKPLLSTEHFSVDGTLIEAWASMKSFRPKDVSGEPPAPGRNGERDFHGERRSNETHASTTDPDAKLFRKAAGQAAKLCHMGHVLMENRNGLVVDTTTTTATGTAEREAAIAMVGDRPDGGRITLGGDKAYDTQDFVAECSAGSRRSAACAKPVIAAPLGSAGCSPSWRPRTMLCASRSCFLVRRSHARTLSASTIFARQRGTTGKPPCETPLSRYKPVPQLTYFPQPAKEKGSRGEGLK